MRETKLFKLAFHQHLESRLSSVIEATLADKSAEKISALVSDEAYWNFPGVPDLMIKDQNRWMKDYAADIVSGIVFQIKTLSQRFETIRRIPYLVTAKPAYSTVILIGLGVLVGILACVLLFMIDSVSASMRRQFKPV